MSHVENVTNTMLVKQDARSGKESMNIDCLYLNLRIPELPQSLNTLQNRGHSVKDMQFSLLEWCSLKYQRSHY